MNKTGLKSILAMQQRCHWWWQNSGNLKMQMSDSPCVVLWWYRILLRTAPHRDWCRILSHIAPWSERCRILWRTAPWSERCRILSRTAPWSERCRILSHTAPWSERCRILLRTAPQSDCHAEHLYFYVSDVWSTATTPLMLNHTLTPRLTKIVPDSFMCDLDNNHYMDMICMLIFRITSQHTAGFFFCVVFFSLFFWVGGGGGWWIYLTFNYQNYTV